MSTEGFEGFEGKVALVTGGSSGIGEQTALGLKRAGFTTYAVARRVDRMAGLEAEGVHAFAMDVTDDASVVGGIERIIAEQGRIDVLVNNAGYGSYGAVEDVPLEEARRQFEVNLFGLARVTQLVIPGMRERGSGRIVNVSSMGGRFAMPFGAWYHATKFAVEGFSDALRQELAPFGVQVVVIEPGGIKTEWGAISAASALEQSGGGSYAARVQRVARALAGSDQRFGSAPSVVAKAITAAVTAKRPRTRYAIGAGAKPVIIARRLLPDRAMDALIGRVLG